MEDLIKIGISACLLGEKVRYDGGHKLDRFIKNTLGQYLEFLPGKEKSNKLVEILQLYLNDGLEFDFAFKVKADSLVPVSLDDDRIKLGSTSWLGKPQMDYMKVYIDYEEILQIN